MRRVVSRLLLVALAVAALVAVIRVSSGGRAGAVVDLDDLRSESIAHAAFSVDAEARIAIDAVGSFEERPDTALAAFGWIVRRADGALVWRQRAGRRPERGFASEQQDTLALAPGTYDAYFSSYGDPDLRASAARPAESFGGRLRDALSRGGRAWVGDAERWHLVVSGASVADRASLQALDDEDARPTTGVAWSSGPVGSDETESGLLRVSEASDVTVEAILEAAGATARDHASLVRLGARVDTVWTFRAAGSAWAGGAARNRHVRARLRLEPGLYRASVQTDGAHAWRDWSATPPWRPAMWGLTVYGTGAVAVLDLDALARGVRRETSELPVIAEMRCVGSDETREARFDLTRPVEALLVAQGEIDGSDAYDFATLLRDGRPVWTMRRGETEAAGGRGSNRRSAVHLSLVPGTYTLRYETDDAHDCLDGFVGDSGDGLDDPLLWGAVLVSLTPDLDLATAVANQTETPSTEARGAASSAKPPPPPPGAASRPGVLAEFVRVPDRARLVALFTLADEARIRIVAEGELLPGERLDYGWIEDGGGTIVWEMTRANTEPAGGAAKNRRVDTTVTLAPGRYVAHYVTNRRHAFGSFDEAPDDPDAWGMRVERLGETEVRL